jgi:hypothetical protein
MRFFSYLLTLLTFALVAGCGGGGGSAGTTSNTTAFFTTAPSTLTVGIGTSQQFDIGGGRSPYTAVSGNSSIVVATLTGTKLTLGGVAPGSTVVTLRDGEGTLQSLAVTVAPAQALTSTVPSGLVIAVGAANAQGFNLSGGVAPYSVVSSNPTVLAATVSGSRVTLTGLTAGTANVVLSDNVGTTLTVPITVSSSAGPALFTTAPSALTVTRGTTPSYSIGGGIGPYTVTSSNTGVLNATVVGNTLTLSTVGNGAATLLVRDAANSTVTIAATVASAPITLNPTAYTAFVGDVLYSTIQGGIAPFTGLSGFPDVADVDIGTVTGGVFTPNTSGNIVRVRVKQAVGSDNIIVSDATGSTANITLTASAATNAINLSPKTLAISEDFAGPIQLMLYGASGTTNIFTDNPNLITVTTPITGSATGTAVTITATGNDNICATGVVNITAVDASGAVGTSAITVTKNRASTPPGC